VSPKGVEPHVAMLVEAAKKGARRDAKLNEIYEHEKQRGNPNQATIAIGRRLVAYLLACDRENRAFRPELAETAAAYRVRARRCFRSCPHRMLSARISRNRGCDHEGRLAPLKDAKRLRQHDLRVIEVHVRRIWRSERRNPINQRVFAKHIGDRHI
jgi:hypothetical protein